MLAVQHYALTDPSVDVNGALIDNQNDNIGGVI